MKITMKKLMELNDKTQRLVSESLDEDEVKKVVNSAVSVYDGDEDEDVNEIDVSKLFEFYMDALNKLDMKAVY